LPRDGSRNKDSMLALTLATSAYRATPVARHAQHSAYRTSSPLATVEGAAQSTDLVPAVLPPSSKAEMLQQAKSCVKRAKDDGVDRYTLRLFLPRPDRQSELTPPDESWEGGIMQLYSVASPLTRELLQYAAMLLKSWTSRLA